MQGTLLQNRHGHVIVNRWGGRKERNQLEVDDRKGDIERIEQKIRCVKKTLWFEKMKCNRLC